VGRHVHLFASRAGKKKKKKKPRRTSRAQKIGRRSGEDQLKLASLSSGVEVALVVSASINWGKRCPHFLAETRRAARNREKKKKRRHPHLASFGAPRGGRHPARVWSDEPKYLTRQKYLTTSF
jgi:hypothetical protein